MQRFLSPFLTITPISLLIAFSGNIYAMTVFFIFLVISIIVHSSKMNIGKEIIYVQDALEAVKHKIKQSEIEKDAHTKQNNNNQIDETQQKILDACQELYVGKVYQQYGETFEVLAFSEKTGKVSVKNLDTNKCKEINVFDIPNPTDEIIRTWKTFIPTINSLEDLLNLKWLHLSEKSFSTLPESIGQLQNLQVLDLERCKNLTTLPESIGQLQNLQKLDLGNCEKLTTLPESIGQLQNLQELNLFRCENLTTLPESIW